MKIFLTGATGFLGTYLLRGLSGRHTLFAAARSPDKLRGKGLVEPVPFTEDLERTVRELEPDIVVNLLGILREDPAAGSTFEKVHYEYARSLIRGARKAGVKRFVQVSAIGASAVAASRYQRTKGMAEEFLIGSGLEFTIVRPSIITGPGQRFFSDLKNLSAFAPILAAPSDVKLEPVHVQDAADCLIKAAEGRARNEILELGGGKVVTFLDFFKFALAYLEIDKRVLGLPRLMFAPAIPFFSFLKSPPMTSDQYRMLAADNVTSGRYRGVKELLGKVRDPFDIPREGPGTGAL